MKNALVAIVRSLSLLVIALAAFHSTESIAVAGSSYARTCVQKPYVAYYGRPADPTGQDFWATQMGSKF